MALGRQGERCSTCKSKSHQECKQRCHQPQTTSCHAYKSPGLRPRRHLALGGAQLSGAPQCPSPDRLACRTPSHGLVRSYYRDPPLPLLCFACAHVHSPSPARRLVGGCRSAAATCLCLALPSPPSLASLLEVSQGGGVQGSSLALQASWCWC